MATRVLGSKRRTDISRVPLVLLFVFSTGSAGMATKTISEQENLDCQACHAEVDQSLETLTDQGLYYQYLRTLAGYEEVLERFETCSYCHVERAGSEALTAEGHRFRWMMEDMVGLRAWLEQHHPVPSEEEDTDQE